MIEYISRVDLLDLCMWGEGEHGTFPAHFSPNAQKIVADQYFRIGEDHFADTVMRVVNEITHFGRDHEYFDYPDAQSFARALAEGIVNQKFSFNSPVWYNVGVNDEPQCSACFIQSVDDNVDSIMNLAKKEALLFKHGSGTGTNLSPLRSSKDRLSKSDGFASGPVSFMRMYDAVAGTIKSGGRTRRAAKMQLLDATHKDIEEFIWCKALEDKRAHLLIEAGMDPQEAYASVSLQNLNHSVRFTDSDIAKKDDLMWQVAEAAWECGDPGVQFTDTINREHMVPSAGAINASNPCSEYVFLDESACNLASLNMLKFMTTSGDINYVSLENAVTHLITAMDIIVDMSGYPTDDIKWNSKMFRPLGLGVSNVGATLMRLGVGYNSDEGRAMAAAFMERVTYYSAYTSGMLAKKFSAHLCYDGSIEIPILEKQISSIPPVVMDYGLRNAQLTCIAPTGTISFMMDCESTGCEPVLAPQQVKNLAGGGTVTMEPECVTLGSKFADIMVSQTALGANPVTPEGHLLMVAALQKHMSGAISKTVNLPSWATVDDVYKVFTKAHLLGVKCITIYRDGCKAYQPVTTQKANDPAAQKANDRTRLPDERQSVTHKFNVGGVEGYLTVGLYADGQPGELFVKIAKEGSTASGFMDSWATMVSLLLQHGLPLSRIVDKFSGSTFEPHGMTTNPDIPMANSIVDYIVRWMDAKFGGERAGAEVPELVGDRTVHGVVDRGAAAWDGSTCPACGGLLSITGTCKSCGSCGWTGGCG